VKQTLKSGTARKGDPVMFEVAADAFAPDRRTVLIPKGAVGRGVVEESRASGPFGRGGSIRVRCDFIQLSDGTRVPLRPSAAISREHGKNRSGGALGTGLLLGAVTGLVYSAAAAPVAVLGSQPGGSASSVTGPALGIFFGTALLTSALTRGGSATLHEGRLFEAATAEEVVLPSDPQRGITARPATDNARSLGLTRAEGG
jgi:hypothetical protein